MIDPSQTVYYISYGLLCLVIGIVYLKIRSTEGITITTNEFKLFQSGFLTGYCMMILGELMSTACFFHSFLYLKLPVDKITKLYVVTMVATTAFGIVVEVVDIGSRKNKCILSSSLYCVAMMSLFFGGHFEMLMLGRVVFGAASALHHSSFDSYVIHEHTSQGFPDDWLSQTFSFLTHGMALVAGLSGALGQTAGSAAPLGTAALCCSLFALSGTYIAMVWTKDGFNGSKFLLAPFLQNLGQTMNAARANKQVLLLLGVTSMSEAAITVFTFYWAPWLFGLVAADSFASGLPYEIIYSSFIIASMLGNYGHQMIGGATAGQGGADSLFQGLLLTAAGAFFLGAVFQTTYLAYISSLVVQLCVGGYWPCVGTLRGRLVMPELRASLMTVSRLLTLLTASSVLTLIHYNSMLTLSACASLFAGAAYCQSQLAAQGEGKLLDGDEDDLEDSDS